MPYVIFRANRIFLWNILREDYRIIHHQRMIRNHSNSDNPKNETNSSSISVNKAIFWAFALAVVREKFSRKLRDAWILNSHEEIVCHKFGVWKIEKYRGSARKFKLLTSYVLWLARRISIEGLEELVFFSKYAERISRQREREWD